jgi:uroporphyrinogen-III synthase
MATNCLKVLPVSNQPLRVLVTRPQPQADELLTLLSAQGIDAYHLPLFDYVAATNTTALTAQIQALDANNSLAIFVSAAAVTFAQSLLPLSQWPVQHIVAVGNKTAQALQQLGVACETPKQQCSEGILQLPSLQQVQQKTVVIVRGDGGREIIAEQLSAKGAIIRYIECYQRQWREYQINELNTQLKNWQINGIVSTSNALLIRLVSLLKKAELTEQRYWFEQCQWFVISERMLAQAKQLGIQRVVNVGTANNHQLQQFISTFGNAL